MTVAPNALASWTAADPAPPAAAWMRTTSPGTRDFFFFAFAAFFFMEGANRVALLFFAHPNEGSPWIYLVRLFALLLILGAILHKNYGRQV